MLIHRRQILSGLASGLAGMPLAAILADPRLARAAAESLQETQIQTAGGLTVSAALALPEKMPAPAILLCHEWWGLNDQVKAMAAELAKEGYVALASDIYGGQVADTPEGARSLMQAVKPAEATDILVGWSEWLKKHEATTGKLGTVGWCMGGGWSLNTSIAEPVQATVIYYGRVDQPKEELARLQGPVLGHFATKDQWINKEMVDGFEEKMKELGKPYEVYWYDAEHAFANPTRAVYDEPDAKLAWKRTLEFYAKNLG